MKRSLWFVVPAHGRVALTRICLTQLRRTCDRLTQAGVDATAVVVADDDNLDTALELGFGTVESDNQFVSRRFNDGIQVACDPQVNPDPADYVVPFGSDDWADWRIFQDLPEDANTMHGYPSLSFVRGDALEMTSVTLGNPGGCGIRVYPAAMMRTLGYRPADEDRPRGCDTSILTNLREHVPDLKVMHLRTDPRQIVDWKTDGHQLNEYDEVLRRHRGTAQADVFERLADIYQADALDQMRHHYHGALVA
jgi:hypothetical protein